MHAYDNYAPLVNFWHYYLGDPEAVRLAVYEILSLYTRSDMNRLVKRYRKVSDTLQSASLFLIQNRLAFNGSPYRKLQPYGLAADGEYIRQQHPKQFGRTQVFTNWDFWKTKPLHKLNVTLADFSEIFWIHEHQFAYIDPPYFGNESEYGGSRENGFDHDLLAELVRNRKKTAISYNDHPKARELYDNHNFHVQRHHRCRLRSDGRAELLILSQDIAEQIQPYPEQLLLF